MYVGASTRLIRGTLLRLAWLGVERIRDLEVEVDLYTSGCNRVLEDWSHTAFVYVLIVGDNLMGDVVGEHVWWSQYCW